MTFPVFLHDVARLGAHPHDLFSQHQRRTVINHSKVYLEFILTLANELELLVKYERGWGKGRKFDELLQGDVVELWQRFYRTFMSSKEWDELRYVIKLSSIGERMEPAKVRQFVLEQAMGTDSFEKLVEKVQSSMPEFYRKLDDPNWKVRREKRNPSWEELELPLLKIVLDELAWLGIVSLENGQIKLTPEGKKLVDGDRPSISLAKPVVKPDYEIIVPKNVHPSIIYFLEKIGDRSSEDSVFIYRIDSFTIQRAIESGMDTKQILEEMESWGLLPQNVTENVKTWASRFSRIKMRFGVLMEFEEPSLMKEVLSSRSLEKYIQPITDRLALVKASDMKKVVDLLKVKGYFTEVPKEWTEKRVLFLSREEALLLEKVLESVKYELKFPQNTIVDDIIERLTKNDSS